MRAWARVGLVSIVVLGPACENTVQIARDARYDVLVKHVGDGQGSVVVTPIGQDACVKLDCSSSPEVDECWMCAEGTNITLSAEPREHTRFAGWSHGAFDGGSQPCTSDVCELQADEDFVLTATFERVQYELTLCREGTGTGTLALSDGSYRCEDAECRTPIGGGAALVVEAQPNVRSAFAGWVGACEELSSGSCSLEMSGPIRLCARFEDVTIPTIGPPVEIASVGVSGGDWCWFSDMRRAVAHDGTTTVVGVGHHLACSARVDRIEVFESTSGAAAFAPVTLHTSDYSSAPIDGPWGRGAPGQITAFADPMGGFHVAAPLREGSTEWEPDRLWNAWRPRGGTWSSMAAGPSSATVQQQQGNTRGMKYSGFDAISLGWSTTAAEVVFLAIDTAWFATQYNVVMATGKPSMGSWTAASAQYTRSNGTVDHSALGGADQDWLGDDAAQVWIDKHTCSINIRERSGGEQWSLPEQLTIAGVPCTSDPLSHYGFQSSVDVAYVDGEPEIWLIRRFANDIELQRHRRDAGGWSVSMWTRPWSKTFYSPKLFVHDGVRPLVLHRDVTDRSIAVFDPESSRETTLHTSSLEIRQIDLAKHDPSVVLWTERDSSTGIEHLFAADLEL